MGLTLPEICTARPFPQGLSVTFCDFNDVLIRVCVSKMAGRQDNQRTVLQPDFWQHNRGICPAVVIFHRHQAAL